MGHIMKCEKCKKVQRWESGLIEVSEKKEYMWKVECQNRKCKYINYFSPIETEQDKQYHTMMKKSIENPDTTYEFRFI